MKQSRNIGSGFLLALPLALVLALILTLAASLGLAQEPKPQESLSPQGLMGTSFTYQGRLTDGDEPASGVYDFLFRLWDADEEGNLIGSTLFVDDRTLTDGLFTVELDFGSGSLTGEARWLEIQIKRDADADYTLLIPRQRLAPAPAALSLPGLWTQQNGISPNLIGGYSGNWVSDGISEATISGGGLDGNPNRVTDRGGTVGGGEGNQAGSDNGLPDDGGFATVSGGTDNAASNQWATVAGGENNTASGLWSTIGGGQENRASGEHATVGGGRQNSAGGFRATTAGGEGNDASGQWATNSGGLFNVTSGDRSTIGGGRFNQASGELATIAGGDSNSAGGQQSTVGGGDHNVASGSSSFIGGGRSNAAEDAWATVGGGSSNTAGYGGLVGGGYGNVASGDWAMIGGGITNTASLFATTVGGGKGNTASGDRATVAGGDINTANAYAATVGGGGFNLAAGELATVAGGSGNVSSGLWATVGGGKDNVASGTWGATVCGGEDNTASAAKATVGGGQSNTASGGDSTVPGGKQNRAEGDFSFAAGRRAVAHHAGAFVWGDALDADIVSSDNNQFIVRANGGLWFGQATTALTPIIDAGVFISTSTGAYLSSGGAWTNASDRSLKENLAPVNTAQILARLAAMPLATWNYKAQDPSTRHIGPTAQDFYAAFGLGEDQTHIATVDADGVALAAIQELHAENRALQAMVAGLESRLAALEETDRRAGTSRLPAGWLGLGALLLLAGCTVGLRLRRGGKGCEK